MNFVKNNFSKKGKNHQRPSRPFQRNRNQPAESTLDPNLFVKKAAPINELKYVSARTINDLPIDNRMKSNLVAKGYERPTEIQDRTIEAILAKNNVLGIAQTGTGKTGAFLIPVIHTLLGTKPLNQILVVVPTRELAVQVQQEYNTVVKGLGMRSHCFIGGTSVGKDIGLLRQQVHLIIGTPGRLTDLARQGALKLNHFNTLILDEFDRLLDMGFSRDIQFIVKAMHHRQQTILFSATEEKGQRELIRELLHEPVEVRVSNGKSTGDHIDQEIVRVGPGESKIDVLLRMVKDKSFHKVIVFADTKRGVSTMRKKLDQSGVRVDEIHGNKSQNYRLKALNDFKSGKINVLIATDVAARGLDISEVTHVINYQQPRDFDSYIHRIGRTGRAGKGGKAFTFVN
ncbi:MAG TPA: ATP-dependent helicase [Cytophagales bacterium]|jgi:ATP-dependent RNA helicase RhlE|nr:ATP-dependent helicase [Cytophagales bacterium]